MQFLIVAFAAATERLLIQKDRELSEVHRQVIILREASSHDKADQSDSELLYYNTLLIQKQNEILLLLLRETLAQHTNNASTSINSTATSRYTGECWFWCACYTAK
jgi:hypothetical protein